MNKAKEQRLDALLCQFYETQRAIHDLPESATTAKMLRTVRRRNEVRDAIINFIEEVVDEALWDLQEEM